MALALLSTLCPSRPALLWAAAALAQLPHSFCSLPSLSLSLSLPLPALWIFLFVFCLQRSQEIASVWLDRLWALGHTLEPGYRQLPQVKAPGLILPAMTRAARSYRGGGSPQDSSTTGSREESYGPHGQDHPGEPGPTRRGLSQIGDRQAQAQAQGLA